MENLDNFNTDESGFFNNGTGYFINGGLQNEVLETTLPLFQHEYTHYFIFNSSSLGLLLIMCEKINKSDSSKYIMFEEISKYYKRMQEEIATYSEMLSYFKFNGKDEFFKYKKKLQENNPTYYRYYKKMINRNVLLSEALFLKYSLEEIDQLLEVIVKIGCASFNIDVDKLNFGSIQNEKELQTKMSDFRFEFNPNYRFGQFIKNLRRSGDEFKYDIPEMVPITQINKYKIDDYIKLVQSIFPENKMVKLRLSGFELRTSYELFGIPDLSKSFPFIDIKGENCEYIAPELIENPEDLFEIGSVNYVEAIFKYNLCFIVITQDDGKEKVSILLQDELGGYMEFVLELVIAHGAILRLHDFHIFDFPNWKILLDVLPQKTYLCVSNTIYSSIDKICKNLENEKFKIIESNGYSLLVIQSSGLILIQPIVTQYAQMLNGIFEQLGFDNIDNIDEVDECIKVGNFIMKGATIFRNLKF